MRLRIHDPGRQSLHRGIRTAIGVPLATALGLALLGGSPGVIVACFGAVSLLSVADFPGSAGERLRTTLLYGVLGAVLILIGLTAGLAVWSVVVATLVVGSLLSFAGMLHGSIAMGAPGLLMIYVVTATLAKPLEALGSLMQGWLVALAVSVAVSQLVFPRKRSGRVRAALIAALHACAEQIRVAADGHDVDEAILQHHIDAMRGAYLGDLSRESGIDPRARALMSLVTQTESLLTALQRTPRYDPAIPLLPGSVDTARMAADCAEVIARAVGGDPAARPSALDLADRWQAQWFEAVRAVRQSPSGGEAIATVDRAFPQRAVSAGVIRLVALCRMSLGLPEEEFPTGNDLRTIPVPPRHSAWDELRAQTHLSSPWLRSALRTGAGLAISVLAVSLLGLAHGFWVLLGVLAVLRLDTQSTLATAGRALIGTVIGAALGFGILVLDPDNALIMWVLFIALAFLATWSVGAIGFTVGQAFFSTYVIVAFSLISWPPELVTALQRMENIVIGVAISLLVAILLWPHGVLRGVRRDVAEAIRSGTLTLAAGAGAIVHGPRRDVEPLVARNVSWILRSESMVDLALAHTDPATTQRHMMWKQLLDDLRVLLMAGHLLALWAQDRPGVDAVLPQLAPPMDADIAATTVAWDAVAEHILDDDVPAPEPPLSNTLEAIAMVADSVDRTAPMVADRIVAATWTHGWLNLTLTAALEAKVPPPLGRGAGPQEAVWHTHGVPRV